MKDIRDIAKTEKPEYRVLWTWDYCTLWDDSYFARGMGAFGPNQRRAYFLRDYKRMVDFCSDRGIGGIVIWGALRAHNSGEEQLKELVRYGRSKQVRILPGVGIFGYGGIYYDSRKEYTGWVDIPMGSNPYSLHSWLSDHPEFAAVGADGKPMKTGMYSDVACPSRPENLAWFREALVWLFTEFGVDGVQVEIGDYSVCRCEKCAAKRTGGDMSMFFVEDMIEPYTAACDTARRINPGAWVLCEAYSSFAEPLSPEQPGFFSALNDRQKTLLSQLPENAVVQWASDRAAGLQATHAWGPDVVLPNKNNIARIHAGSQHSFHGIGDWGVHTIGDLVRKARLSGVNGVSIFGEESPAAPPNEANYLIFSEFCGCGNPNPGCAADLFFANTLDPLYGGSGMAGEWERIYVTALSMMPDKNRLSATVSCPEGDARLFESVARMNASDKRQTALRLADEVHSISGKLSGEPCRRWSWLENRLWRDEFLYRTAVADYTT